MGKFKAAVRTVQLIAGSAICSATLAVSPAARAQTDTNSRELETPASGDDDQSNRVGCKKSNVNGTTTFKEIAEARDATAIVGLHPCWQADTSNSKYRLMNDLYAQWTIERIESDDHTDRPRLYQKESRPAFVRLFIGKNVSMVSSVKIVMHDPDISFTVPLAAFGYEGRIGKGESWVTDVVSDDQSQPFFRIGPATSATIAVSAKSSQEVEVRATSAVLGALRAISSIVSPGGSLVTKLNAESLNRSATAMDSALGGVWSETIDERQISSRQMSEWYEDSSFLVQVTIPKFVKTHGSSSDGTTTRWYRLRLSCPRYSIFDPKPACAENLRPTLDNSTGSGSLYTGDDYRTEMGYSGYGFQRAVRPLSVRVSAQQVLNYPLSQGKTIQDHLASQIYYTRFLRLADPTTEQEADPAGTNEGTAQAASGDNAPTPAKSKPNPTAKERTREDFSTFCRSTVDLLYDAKLSSFDARLGLWAVITGSLDLVSLNDDFQRNSDCRYLLPGGEYGPWRYAELPIDNPSAKAPPKPPKQRR